VTTTKSPGPETARAANRGTVTNRSSGTCTERRTPYAMHALGDSRQMWRRDWTMRNRGVT
jgi:hypothetical protein